MSLVCLGWLAGMEGLMGGALKIFPGQEWREAAPESQGVNAATLKEAVAFMETQFGSGGAKELVIVRHGYLIWQGTNCDVRHNVWSATKTFTSTLLGLLIAEEKCALDDPAAKHLPQLTDQYPTYARITLRHLASMSSGYRGELMDVNAAQPWGDPMAYLRPGTPLFEPGTQVQYHDHQVFLLGHILTQLAGESERTFFQRRIAGPIGMRHWDWGVSGQVNGLELNNAAGTPSRAPGIETTAREMARFGWLYLNRGQWNGKPLLPASFVDEATRNQVPGSGASAFLHGRYGFYWWTNDRKPNGQRPWPSAPPRTYTAHGHNCNFCFVVPEWDMVIVRLGTEPIRGGVAGLTEVERLWDTFLGKLAEAVQ